jgi:ArsR family transcriptional regulator, arsenate/arsenite/antimonite-responsive transcriptional repressor
MRGLEQLFKGLADMTRLRILNLLLHGELCVCDIQFVLGSSQPNISRHLTYLRNSGLVLDRREGARIYYRLPPSDSEDRQHLFNFLQAAFRQEPGFGEDSRRLKEAITSGACSVSEWVPFSGLRPGAHTERR